MKDPAVVTTPARELADFAATLRFESLPPAVVDRTEDLFLDWFASALAGKGARPVETIAAFYESQGPATRPVRDPDSPHDVVADDRRGGQRGLLALRRAGRRAQQLGVPSGGGRHSARARGRAGDRRLGPRPRHRHRGRLRSRHPRRRVPRPLALPDLPHDRHRGHGGRRRCGRAAARPHGRPDAARVRLGRHAGRGAVGVPARRGGLEAAALRACRGIGPRRRPSCAQGPDRRAPHLRRAARHGGRDVDGLRSGPPRRSPGRPLGAGRDLVQVPRVVPAHAPRGRRAAVGDDEGAAEGRPRRPRHRARAQGRDRRPRAGDRPADRAPVEVLDGHRARTDRDPRPCRADRLRQGLPRPEGASRSASA